MTQFSTKECVIYAVFKSKSQNYEEVTCGCFGHFPVPGRLSTESSRVYGSAHRWILEEGYTTVGKKRAVCCWGSEWYSIFWGSVLVYDDCVIGVVPLEDQDLVYSVLVSILNFHDWASLQNTYFDLKKKLTKEYGKPKKSEETIATPVQSDAEKFQSVIDGWCDYKTTFMTEYGEVDLSIESFEGAPCMIIQYTDLENALKGK